MIALVIVSLALIAFAAYMAATDDVARNDRGTFALFALLILIFPVVGIAALATGVTP